MKKIGLLTREKIIGEVQKKLEGTSGCFFVGFNKINALAFNALRSDLKGQGARVFVTKNSLLKRAFEGLKLDQLLEFIESETGLVLAYEEDVAKICKTLVNFSKENEALQLKGGVIEDKKISLEELKNLATLPSREALLGMVVYGLASPLTGFLNSLNQIILKFVWVVEEIKKKGNQSNPSKEG